MTSALAWLFVMTVGTAAAQPPAAQGRAACPADRTVAVSGSGAVTAQPDRAVVNIGVRSEADTAEAALAANSGAMESAIAAVKGAGVPPADIRTLTVRLFPRYGGPTQRSSEGGGERGMVGYTATNTVRVRVDDLGALGGLLDAVVAAGANTIEGVQFEVGDPSAMLDQARAAAWADARHEAEQLATLAGARLGEVLAISESSGTPRPMMAEAVMAKAAAVPVEPGTQIVTSELQVTWRLLPLQ